MKTGRCMQKVFYPFSKFIGLMYTKCIPFFLDYANSRLSVTKCPFVRENENRYELWCNVLFGSGVGVWGDRKVISGLFQQKTPFHCGIPSLKVVVEGGWVGGWWVKLVSHWCPLYNFSNIICNHLFSHPVTCKLYYPMTYCWTANMSWRTCVVVKQIQSNYDILPWSETTKWYICILSY